jgi:thioredoxin 1
MSDHVIHVTAASWAADVVQADLPVIVDLWAPWCGPCLAIAPLLDELGEKWAGKVKVVKVNVDEQPEIAGAFEVQSIPTLGVVFRGALYGKVEGFGGRAHLEQLFEQVANLPTEQPAEPADPTSTDA